MVVQCALDFAIFNRIWTFTRALIVHLMAHIAARLDRVRAIFLHMVIPQEILFGVPPEDVSIVPLGIFQ